MKTSKIFIYIFAVFVLLLFVQCSSNHKKINKELTKSAAVENLTTPTLYDAHTRLDSVAVTSDNIFQYYYTLIDIDNPSELLRHQKTEIMKNIDKTYSSDDRMRFFIRNKVIMEYIYRDTAMNVIDVITIETDKYKK